MSLQEEQNLKELVDIFSKNRGISLNDIDKLAYFYNKAFEQKYKHDSPSDTTLKMFKNMEKEIGEVKTSVARIEGSVDKIATVVQYVKESQDEFKADFKEHKNTEDNFINKADEKYAVKTVEKDLKELANTINVRNYDWLKYAITAVITALLVKFIK